MKVLLIGVGTEVCFIRNANLIISNNFSGWHDAPNYPNWGAFATLQGDGSIKAWGSSGHGGTDAPSGSGYKSGKGTPVRIIWRIMPPTKIITGSRITHLSKTQKINAHNLNFR
jgi:hypothetical protein